MTYAQLRDYWERRAAIEISPNRRWAYYMRADLYASWI